MRIPEGPRTMQVDFFNDLPVATMANLMI